MIRLIGFSGYARSGKDTAAQALLYAGWTRAAFADALKHDAAMALRTSLIAGHINPPSEEVDTWFSNPELKESFRPLLVEYGRAMRRLRPDYWVTRLALDLDPAVKYAITDVRYANEAEWIRLAGGKVIELVRPDVGPANYEEERSLKEFAADAIIRNDGSIQELHSRIAGYLKGVTGT